MKIVVTGALGHIGSRLIRDLALQFPATEIVLLDNMMTQRYGSLFNLPVVGRYRFVEIDVAKEDIRPLLDGAHAVIHLAAITDAAGSFERATEVENNNFNSTRLVAEACIATGSRLLALSSTSVYGTASDVVSEDCGPDELQPQSPYAVTKLKEERLLDELARQSGLRFISLRLGTIFGASPGMRFHTAVNKFCWQAVMGTALTVWSTALDQKRPYLDLADATRGIVLILREDLFDGRVYNVVTVNATVRQVVDTIREFIPSVSVKFVDSRIMNQLSYEVLCERFGSAGFRSCGSLRRGIGETIALLSSASVSV